MWIWRLAWRRLSPSSITASAHDGYYDAGRRVSFQRRRSQHGALLQREMRFTAWAVINTAGLLVESVVGVGGALAGYGYWALVAMTIRLSTLRLVSGSQRLDTW